MFSSSVVPCHSAPLWSVHNPSASSGHDLSMSLAYTSHSSPSHWVTLFSLSVLFSLESTHLSQLLHLSGQLLTHIALCILATLTALCSSSSNRLLLFADRVKLSSRRFHVVLLDRAFYRALVSDLALCLLHSEASNFAFGAVDSCRLLGLCHPALHGPDSSWDCRRVLHRIPPNEFDRHGPSDLGMHSSRCTRPCKCFSSAIFKLCTFSENCSPDLKAGSLFIMSESWAVFALNMKLSFIRLCIDFAWLWTAELR